MANYVIESGNVFLKDDKGNLFIVGASTKTVTTRIDDLTVQDTVYNFDTTAGDYVQGTSTTRSYPLPVGDAQTSKISSLQTSRDNDIYSTFTSSALGTVKTYNYDKDAADDFLKQTSILALDTSISSVDWYTIESGLVTHTRGEWAQVAHDGSAHERTLKMKYFTKESQVKSATTVTAVNTVGWPKNPNPPSVPTGLTGTAGAAGSGQVTLNWTANTDVTMNGGGGYRVYVDTATTAANTSLVTGTTYTATGLTVGAHTFAITAVDTDGNESSKCSTVSVTVS